MDFLLQPLSIPFMQRALIAGALVGALCATVGVFIVQRGLSFLGDGLAHATTFPLPISVRGSAGSFLIWTPPRSVIPWRARPSRRRAVKCWMPRWTAS